MAPRRRVQPAAGAAARPQTGSKPLPAFPEPDGSSDVEPDTREMVRAQNKKKKKSGGFQSMGLSYPVFKGVMKKGYKVPTPIQRRTIPVILDGKDVVAMARTGSGKTACFLIPMFEKLKVPSAQMGARALILSPTRELALQTMKFTKELGKFTGLKTALILGGDRMEDQFAALHENPDIIIGTPGRLMHVIVEMSLKLHSVEYVVFDEADRLFEMGFAEQLQEIIARLPESRQTLLFSATLPRLLVEFARAGLTEPVLIRLDVETKLSEQLKMAFFHVRPDDKPAVLLHLLRSVVKPQDQTLVFVATKHHAEYLKELLAAQGVSCTHIYSSLDQSARKINLAKFAHGRCSVLIVTDVAARGLDIPMLDNVINYSFPAKAKLFLHRVGRVARAGRSGTAYSLVAPDETPYVLDLHLFLGHPLTFASPHEKPSDRAGVFGRVPQSVVDDEECLLLADHERSLERQSLRQVAENAHKQYLASRPGPSPESIKRAKQLDFSLLGTHPLFSSGFEEDELERVKFVDSIRSYRSKATIFEINATSKTLASDVMRAKRSHDRSRIDAHRRERQAGAALAGQSPAAPAPQDDEGDLQVRRGSSVLRTWALPTSQPHPRLGRLERNCSCLPRACAMAGGRAGLRAPRAGLCWDGGSAAEIAGRLQPWHQPGELAQQLLAGAEGESPCPAPALICPCQEAFGPPGGRKRRRRAAAEGVGAKRRPEAQQEEEFYVPYQPKDLESERGLSVAGEGSAFEQQASGAVLDLLGDDSHTMSKSKQLLRWDRKRKRFVGKTGQEDKQKIYTESGRYISSSYKKNLYENWKKKYKVEERDSEDELGGESRGGMHRRGRGGRRPLRCPGKPGQPQGEVRSELKNKQQILKQRKRVAKQNFLQRGGLRQLKARNRQRVQEMRRAAFGRGTGKKGKMRKKM